jgi:hypothetical protein
MRTGSIAALSMLAAVAAGASARAADADAFAKRMFAGNLATQGKSYVCFVRRYDAAHLKQHREQKITAMKLLVTAELVPEDKALNYSFTLGMKFRDRKGDYQSSGSCGHPMAQEQAPDTLQLGCGVDCDGGGLSVALTNADQSVLVSIEELAIWNNNKPDEERDRFTSGADDKKFLLERVGRDQCKPLMAESQDLAADEQK